MPQPRVYAIDGVTPVVAPSSYVHPSAALIGDVIIGENCYVGPGACLCGDFGRIVLRMAPTSKTRTSCMASPAPTPSSKRTATSAMAPCCTVAVCAVRRACRDEHRLNDNAEIGERAIVGAMSFVKAGMVVPPQILAAGSPARLIRPLTELEMGWKAEGTEAYQDLMRRCLMTMQETVALSAVEPDRKRLDLPEHLSLSQQKARDG